MSNPLRQPGRVAAAVVALAFLLAGGCTPAAPTPTADSAQAASGAEPAGTPGNSGAGPAAPERGSPSDDTGQEGGADGAGADAGPLAPNELGQIMILEYHVIGPQEGRWARTPENFRRDLEALYERGYRPVNVADVVDRRIDLPRGYSPVAITFDDGTAGQFRYIERDGQLVVDPDSAVGVLLRFHEEHPDWPLKASFYVNDVPFEQAQTWQEKVRFLAAQGMEVGNHTLTHADLGKLEAAATARELGSLAHLVAEAEPSLSPTTLALPYGALPRAAEAARAGSYNGRDYRIKAFLLVGANPAPSPYSRRFDPYRLPRVQAVDSRFEARANLAFWLDYFDEQPERRYVSDGNPDTVTAPQDLLGEAAPDAGNVTPR